MIPIHASPAELAAGVNAPAADAEVAPAAAPQAAAAPVAAGAVPQVVNAFGTVLLSNGSGTSSRIGSRHVLLRRGLDEADDATATSDDG